MDRKSIRPRLKDADTIRLIDLVVVKKDDDGTIETLHTSDLTGDEALEFGAVAGALIGLGAAGEEGAEAGAMAGAEAMADGQVFDDDNVWYAADAIPNGTVAQLIINGSNTFLFHVEYRGRNLLVNGVVRQDGRGTPTASCLVWGTVQEIAP